MPSNWVDECNYDITPYYINTDSDFLYKGPINHSNEASGSNPRQAVTMLHLSAPLASLFLFSGFVVAASGIYAPDCSTSWGWVCVYMHSFDVV
jgi:hypothetical protein